MKFLGIDLGWTSGASGLCCLNWSDGSLHLLELDRQQAITDILNWVDKWASPTEPAMIAVDAPTLIPNATGAALKAVEDQLDSLICAYVAAHWWYWGSDRNWVLGDATTGYIVVPAPKDFRF
jgi:predicted RNase H-like nuclease